MNHTKTTQPPLFLSQLEVKQSDALSLTDARRFECEQAVLALEKTSADLPKNIQKNLIALAASSKKLTYHQFCLVREILTESQNCIGRCEGLPEGETRQLTFMFLAGKWNELKKTNPKTADFIKAMSALLQSDRWDTQQVINMVELVLMYACPQLLLVAPDTTLTTHEPLELTYGNVNLRVKPLGMEYFVKSADQTTKLLPGEAVIVTNICDASFETPFEVILTPELVKLPRHVVVSDASVEPFSLVIEVGTDTQAFTVYDAGLKKKLRMQQGENKITHDPKQLEG